MKHMRIELDDQLHRELKIYAATNDKTMMEVAIEALRKFLAEQKEDK